MAGEGIISDLSFSQVDHGTVKNALNNQDFTNLNASSSIVGSSMAGEGIISDLSLLHVGHRTVEKALNNQDLTDLNLDLEGLTKVLELNRHMREEFKRTASELTREYEKSNEKIEGIKKEQEDVKKKPSKFESLDRYVDESEAQKVKSDRAVELRTDLARIHVNLVSFMLEKELVEAKFRRLKDAHEKLKRRDNLEELKPFYVVKDNINPETEVENSDWERKLEDERKVMILDEESRFHQPQKEIYEGSDEEIEAVKVIADHAVKLETDVARLQVDFVCLMSENKIAAAEFQSLKTALDEPKQSESERLLIYDFDGRSADSLEKKKVEEDETKLKITGGESHLRQLLEKIELSKSMIVASTFGLLNLGRMKKEIEGLKVSEEGAAEIESKMSELQSRFEQFKKAMEKLKDDKSKKLVNNVSETEEKKSSEQGAVKGVKGFKLNWPAMVASAGTVAAAAVLLYLGLWYCY